MSKIAFRSALSFNRRIGLHAPARRDVPGAYKSSLEPREDEEEQEDFMQHVGAAVLKAAPVIINGLRSPAGWAVCDGLLSAAACAQLRRESVTLFDSGQFLTSKSSRWDSQTRSLVYYEKRNVFSTELAGNDQYYSAPRLHEYVHATIKTIVPLLQNAFPEAHLSAVLASNKLAVCTGDGSSYDKHYDNSGLTGAHPCVLAVHAAC